MNASLKHLTQAVLLILPVSLALAQQPTAPGDSLALDVDLANNRPLAAKVSTYLDSQKEPVVLDVQFGTLDNNATYASTIVLQANGKNLTVNVQNSGYRKSGN